MKQLLLILLIGYLGLYNGRLALFQGNGDLPEQVLPYCAQTFPETDQNALKSGIPFRNEKELNQLLEDFLS